MSQKTFISSTTTKSQNTYPKSHFTFGIDSNKHQILVANPVKADLKPGTFNPNTMPYDLTIVVGIDANYNGTPSLYYDSSKSAFFVEFDYKHTAIPDTLYKWTITVKNGDGRILKGVDKPKVYLSDTFQTSAEMIIEGKGTETSKGTEVSIKEPPMK